MSDMPQPWVESLTVGQVLAATTERWGDREAAVFVESNYRPTWRQFAADVQQTARALLALGIQKGEHVAVWGTNVPEWVLLQFATAEIGAVLVTINPAYRPFELEFVLRQSNARALFFVDKFKTSDYFAMIAEVCPEFTQKETLASPNFPELRHLIAMRGQPPEGILPWSSFLALSDKVAPAAVHERSQNIQPTDAVNIQYTSGTTGFPKAAMLSHRNLLLNAFYVGQRQNLSEQDRVCIPVPFYHCFGCVMGTLCCAVYGAAMVVPAAYFQPAATLLAVETELATSLYGVPTMFIAQLQDPSFSQRKFSTLRTGIMAGSPCPIEIMRQVGERMGAKEVTIAYGQTEASPVVTQTNYDDLLELRVETVGSPLPGVEVRIVDPATGLPLPDEQPGELCARGHGVMLGYYQQPEATAQAIDADGWLHSGDIGVRLPNGYFKITGRIKDMVIRGGENIYPREIEEFLFHHPAVEQSAVVGVPDTKYGEELCAWIILKPNATASEDEIRAYCRGKLAHYKVPRYIRFVESFPQTVTGKIQKFKIREVMRKELGLEEEKTA